MSHTLSHPTHNQKKPFEAIMELEKEQEALVRLEREDLDRLERKENELLQEEERKRMELARSNAREAFGLYKTTELPKILKAAEESAQAERTRIERAAAAKKQKVVDSLMGRMLSSEFLSRLSA